MRYARPRSCQLHRPRRPERVQFGPEFLYTPRGGPYLVWPCVVIDSESSHASCLLGFPFNVPDGERPDGSPELVTAKKIEVIGNCSDDIDIFLRRVTVDPNIPFQPETWKHLTAYEDCACAKENFTSTLQKESGLSRRMPIKARSGRVRPHRKNQVLLNDILRMRRLI